MNIVDVGTGAPVVLVPGIQGRWEWMKLAVDALARRCRVITFSLADEPSSGASFDEEAGFDAYVRQVADALDERRVDRATICGVSYGGLIAGGFAARYPARAAGLVLTSAIPPSWKPDARARFLLRAPRLLAPVFCVGSLRMLPEIVSARHGLVRGLLFAAVHATRVLTHMFSPLLMARRVEMIRGVSLHDELAPLRLPTLVITGDHRLDRVVPVSMTREYLKMWPHASFAVIARSGHLGLITRADEFAALVGGFAGAASDARVEGRRVG